MIAACAFVACSNEPEYADPEAQEKMTELREKYAPLLVGTWHFERITEKQHFFEQLTFQEDGTLTGIRNGSLENSSLSMANNATPTGKRWRGMLACLRGNGCCYGIVTTKA